MVNGFFPTPYPDECLYSILCRYYVRMGGTGHKYISIDLFGNIQNLTSSVYLPLRIECVDNWASPSSGITRKNIAVNHTLYPYWAISYQSDLCAETERVINGGIPSVELDRASVLKSRRSWSKYLKYCPQCAAEDIAKYGETYWRRQHQLSEMFYCTLHQIRLVESENLVRRTAVNFFPATDAVMAGCNADASDNLADYKDKLLKIGQESEWLIKHGLEVSWGDHGYEKYQLLLRDKGLSSPQGRCDYQEIERASNDYWGKDFLGSLFAEADDSRLSGWTRQLNSYKMLTYRPLYHILLMCFISGSVSEFVESNPASTPYGHPPFICENPICPHYHVDGAKMVTIRYYGNGMIAVFECIHCGMRYKLNRPKYLKEHTTIVDYGHMWNKELLRCCQDPQITNEQAAEILGFSKCVLGKQKKKRGLLQPVLYDEEMGAEQYYKERVSELCEKYDEVTYSILEQHVPGAYDYLIHKHRDWLLSRMVYERNRKHRREYEEQLLQKVRLVIDKFELEGYPERQITFGYIASLVGSARDKLRHRGAIVALLENVIETREVWLRRRIIIAYQLSASSDTPVLVSDIKRNSKISDATYSKHKKQIDEIINELIEQEKQVKPENQVRG